MPSGVRGYSNMKHVITGKDHIFGPWLMEKTGGEWTYGRGTTVGLFDSSLNTIIASTVFTDCNGEDGSVVLHCAGEGKAWLNREFLWYVFHYPFMQLKVHKIISPVESTNLDCIRFIQHIGFSLEATLLDASPKGNLLLFTMNREQCKWLSLRNSYRGEAQGSGRS